VVVDTSVLLAVIFDDAGAAWSLEQLQAHAGELRMSTVSLAEALILVRDRQPHLAPEIEEAMVGGSIRFVAPDVAQARTAAAARLRFPLNLGDCFAYALAAAEGCPILTLDRDFRAVDIPVLLPP
jgi:ribonuclease VapC